MLKLLFEIFINVVFEYTHTNPNSGIINTTFQILDPKFLDSFRVDTPNSDWFFSSTELFLPWLVNLFVYLLLRTGLICSNNLLLSYNFDEQETFLQILYLFFHSSNVFDVRKSKSKLFSFSIICPSIVLYCQIIWKFFLNFHYIIYNFLSKHVIAFQKYALTYRRINLCSWLF